MCDVGAGSEEEVGDVVGGFVILEGIDRWSPGRTSDWYACQSADGKHLPGSPPGIPAAEAAPLFRPT